MTAKVIKLEPRGRYVNGTPFYDFHVPFSSGKVKALDNTFTTIEEAEKDGKDYLAKYEGRTFPGGMGCFLGVVEKDGGYQAVVNTYYSNS